MRTMFLPLALLGVAGPALACVCMEPTTAEEKREIAARIAAEAVAVVDVEQVAAMDQRAMRGETYRVLAVHVGKAPAQFEMARGFERASDGQTVMVMTSCDTIPPPGTRTTAVLYAGDRPGRFRFGGTCEHLFVNLPGGIDLIRAELARRGGKAERG